MSHTEQRRTWVLARLLTGELTRTEAAELLGLSERSIRRLRARLGCEGPAGLVHGNRGRVSPRRLPDAVRERILELAADEYAGLNDSHLADLLAEREGIAIGRSSLQRLLREAGRPSPRKRRSPRHRSRRDRMPREGLLLQTDGSRHDWLEGRGPWLTLVGYIDDATGRVTGATFRDQEDSAGYLEALTATISRYGIPGAIYHDRHTIFEPAESEPLTLEEQLVDSRVPTQLGRTFLELGIGSVRARSPQGKGRVERLWGTLQDRLVAELRIAGVVDRDGANTFLARYLARHNRRFMVPPADPEPAWRRLPTGTRLERNLLLQVPAHRGARRHRARGGHDPAVASEGQRAQPRRPTGRAPRPARWAARGLGRAAGAGHHTRSARCGAAARPRRCPGRGRGDAAQCRHGDQGPGRPSLAPDQARHQALRHDHQREGGADRIH